MSDPTSSKPHLGPIEQSLLLGYGLLLFGLLATFRADVYTNDVANYQGWLVPLLWFRFLRDLALVGLIEGSFWLIGSLLRGRVALRMWTAIVVLAHVFLFAAELCSEQYFLSSGQRLRPSFAFFIVLHPPANVGHIVGPSLGIQFFMRVFVAVVGLALASVLATRARRLPRLRRRALAVVTVTLTTGLLLIPVSAVGSKLFGTSLLGGFLREMSPNLLTRQREALNAVPYVVPQVTAPAPATAPNVIVILLESARPDVLEPGADGSPPTMPFLRSLGERGLLGRDVAVGVSHTSKALVTVFCGMYPKLEMEASQGMPRHDDLACLPKLLTAAGYKTAYFQSASEFEDRARLIRDIGFPEQTLAEKLDGKRYPHTGYVGLDEHAMIEPITRWIEQTKQPFFIGMLTSTTHHPYVTPGAPMETGAPIFTLRRNYRKASAFVDGFLKDFVDRLDQIKALDNTILVILGDHGEEFGDGEHPGFGGHDACPWDQCMHVPFVMYGPKWLGQPRTIDGLRHQLDVLPTILDLTGAKWTGTLPGADMLTTAGHDAVFSSCYWDTTCLVERTKNLATIYSFFDRPLEIYDLASDPGETKDIAGALTEETRQARTRDLLSFYDSVTFFYTAGSSQK